MSFYDPNAADNDKPLGDSRKLLDDGKWDGVRCECCRRLVKVYEREFRATWAATLSMIFDKYALEPFHKKVLNDIPGDDWRFLNGFRLFEKTINPQDGPTTTRVLGNHRPRISVPRRRGDDSKNDPGPR